MKKIKKMAAVIILILIAFIYGHIHKTMRFMTGRLKMISISCWTDHRVR